LQAHAREATVEDAGGAARGVNEQTDAELLAAVHTSRRKAVATLWAGILVQVRVPHLAVVVGEIGVLAVVAAEALALGVRHSHTAPLAARRVVLSAFLLYVRLKAGVAAAAIDVRLGVAVRLAAEEGVLAAAHLCVVLEKKVVLFKRTVFTIDGHLQIFSNKKKSVFVGFVLGAAARLCGVL